MLRVLCALCIFKDAIYGYKWMPRLPHFNGRGHSAKMILVHFIFVVPHVTVSISFHLFINSVKQETSAVCMGKEMKRGNQNIRFPIYT